MSYSNGPKMVTNGLVMCLDAGNRNSYPGSGTTWFDLSGNNNTGSLTNGPTFSTTNNGIIVFDGSNDYAPIGTSSFSFGSSAGTLCVWTTVQSGTTGFRFVLSYGTAATGNARFLGINTSTYYFGGYGSDIQAGGVLGDAWVNMVGVYDGAYASLYINSTLVSGPTLRSWNTIAGSAQVGRQVNGGEYWRGNVAQAFIYNRALSATEIRQNYNTTKGRFLL